LIRYAPENLLTRSQDFEQASGWNQGSFAAITANQIASPSGVVDADLITARNVSYGGLVRKTDPPTYIARTTYTMSVYAKAGTHQFVALRASGDCALLGGNIYSVFTLSGAGSATAPTPISGTINSVSCVSVGDGWYRCTLVYTTGSTAPSSTTDIAICQSNGNVSFTPTGTETVYIWGAQLERHSSARAYIPTTTAAVYNARFDHDPVTLACKGLLIEESRTNLTVRSDDFSATEWNSISQRNLTVTANNTTSPSGATDADLLTVGATTTAYQVVQSLPATGNVTSGTAYTVSCYFKPNQVTRVNIWAGNTVTFPADAIFDLTGSGSVVLTNAGTASIQQVGNGWYRCIVTGTAGATSNTTLRFSPVSGTSRTYAGNSVDSFWAWGAQLEAGAFPTSYIPTTTASVVRSADVCSITGSDFTGMWQGATSATMILEANASIMPTSLTGNRSLLILSNGAAYVNQIGYLKPSTSDIIRSRTATFSSLAEIANSLGKFKGAISIGPSNSAGCFNGGAVSTVTDSMGTVDRITFSDPTQNAAGHPSMWVSGFQIYRKRLSDAKIQALTTL
jgi:hypothetical protein